jgi:Bacterial regulatory helix-turn-helix protein, lysR family
MDRLEAMSLVLAVAEAGSLSAAARQEKAPLATVSRKMSELEAHLRTKLFNRSSRALVPTDAGAPTSPPQSGFLPTWPRLSAPPPANTRRHAAT